jgi:hypothetical protein
LLGLDDVAIGVATGDCLDAAKMSPVRATCVPPQSSVEKSPNASTRTTSSYFSPKSAIAPDATASSYDMSRMFAPRFARISSLTSRSISASASSRGAPRRRARAGRRRF